MKIKINKSKLKEGINITERISLKSTSLPILKNILINTYKNFISISSTDLETAIQWWGITKVDNEGSIAIPANLLSGFINFLPEKNIELTLKEKDLLIECDNYNTQIKGFNTDDFPIIPEVLEKNSIIIDCKILCKSLSQIIDIPNFSTTRPEISGIYFKFKNNQLKIVATDSYRLGEKIIILNDFLDNEFSFILPQKAAKEIISIFSEKEGKMKILIGSNQVLFEISMIEMKHPHIRLTSRIIEGNYPNYEEIIPSKNEISAVLDKLDFLNQIKAASLFSGKINEVFLKIDPSKETINILSKSPDSGEFSSFVSGKIKGKKEEVSFNYKFLVDGLSNIETKNILFEINNSSSPGVLKPVGENDFLYIVMPIKGN